MEFLQGYLIYSSGLSLSHNFTHPSYSLILSLSNTNGSPQKSQACSGRLIAESRPVLIIKNERKLFLPSHMIVMINITPLKNTSAVNYGVKMIQIIQDREINTCHAPAIR